jgi:hypothetical protein
MISRTPILTLGAFVCLLSLLCVYAWSTHAQNPQIDSSAASLSPDATLTQLSMSGEPGDYIGGTTAYSYTTSTGTFSASAGDNNSDGKADSIQISYNDTGFNNWWYVNFNTYHVTGQNLVPGFYDNAQRAPFASSGHPGIDISGNGRGCNTITGNFTVHEANFDNTVSPPKVLNFTASFEQHCEGGTAALLGTIYYNYTGASQVSYAISGNVSDNFGTPVANMPVVLSGSQNANGTTDSGGNYFFGQLLGAGNFRLTPTAGTGYVLTPTTQSVKRLAANTGVNFTAVPLYTLSGQIVNGSSVPVTGVSVALTGSQTGSASTDNNGNYSFANLRADGSFTLTPTRTNYNFTPTKAVFNTLIGNTTANFTGNLNTYTIGGRLIDNNGIGISQATVSLSGGQASTTQSDANGNYSFPNLTATGSFTVTPSKVNYSFAPASQSFSNLSSNFTSVNFAGTLKTFTISGVILDGNGNGVPGLVLTLSGSQSGTNGTDSNGNYSFTVVAGGSYTVTPPANAYTFTPTSRTFNNISANQTGNFVAAAKSIQFGGSTYGANEGSGSCSVNIVRSGDTSAAASVSFATSNGTAIEGKDYVFASGVLNFAAAETSKTFPVLLIDNAFVDGARTVNLSLSSPTGAALGTQSTVVLTINDNDSALGSNPVDQQRSFVQFHYYDFLGRYPDPSGWDFWTNNISGCSPQPSCVNVQRINTSAAYFLSIEFQQTGYLVYRIYKASFGNITDIPNAPVPIKRQEFAPDTQQIGNGVIVNQGNWQQQLETNKQAFTLEFVQRARFTAAFPTTMTPAQFVEKLFSNAGVTPSAADRNAAIAEFGSAITASDVPARSRALRDVAENATLNTQEFNKAFVLMQYFGYLRRNPYDPPEATLDYSGFNFWLGKLNSFGGDYINAEMVKAFISSSEYRQRFGP